MTHLLMSNHEDYEVKLARLAMILTMVEYKKAFERLSRESCSKHEGVILLCEQTDELLRKSKSGKLSNKEYMREFKTIAALAMRAMVEFGLKNQD